MPNIYLDEKQERLLAERSREDARDRSEVIRRMMVRYDEVVLADRPKLSRKEWSLVADALNGCWMMDTPSHWAMASIADHVSLNAADRKWEVDWPTLRAKLEALSRGGWVALVDLVERFWLATGHEPGVELPDDGGANEGR